MLEETSDEQTLEMAWNFLDSQFQTPEKPSQEILASLQQRAEIPPSSPKELTAFAQTCLAAVTIMECSQGVLPSLNELVTQKAIVSRLNPQLRHDWYKYRCEVLKSDGAVPFKKFAKLTKPCLR